MTHIVLVRSTSLLFAVFSRAAQKSGGLLVPISSRTLKAFKSGVLSGSSRKRHLVILQTKCISRSVKRLTFYPCRIGLFQMILFYYTKLFIALLLWVFPIILTFSGQSRLRFCRMDKMSLVSSIILATKASRATTNNALASSFFYRAHLLWNDLPLEIRSIDCPVGFKISLKKHLWASLLDPTV